MIFKNIELLVKKFIACPKFLINPCHHRKVIEFNRKFSEQAAHTRRKESYHMAKIIPEIKGESNSHDFAEYIKRIKLFLEICCKSL